MANSGHNTNGCRFFIGGVLPLDQNIRDQSTVGLTMHQTVSTRTARLAHVQLG
jgi:hypothetical protein